VAPHAESLERDDTVLDEIEAHSAYRRARELAAVGLRSEATLEWQLGAAALEDSQRIQSIHLAAGHGLYDIAVATATRYGVFADYALLYPRPFGPAVEQAARNHGVAPNLLLALMRQESLFRSDAASGSGALGLMQLRPETAVRAARAAGLPAPAARDLFDPDTNLTVGSAHLKALMTEFGDRLPVALAAYNAGPAAARRWLPSNMLDADIWIENIPYNETRAYVRRVLWHRVVFDWLETGRAIDVEAWLEPVGPSSEAG
jgi:soluble lytic murein transglycosylase